MREVLVARIVQALLALVVGLILAACGPSIDDSTIGNSTNIVPSLIKEVADQPPKFSPSYKIVRGTFTDQFDIVLGLAKAISNSCIGTVRQNELEPCGAVS